MKAPPHTRGSTLDSGKQATSIEGGGRRPAGPGLAGGGFSLPAAGLYFQLRQSMIVKAAAGNGSPAYAGIDLMGDRIVEATDGAPGSVTFPDELLVRLRDPSSKLSLLHNHPKSTALSTPDILVLENFPGASFIADYGHDGGQTAISRGARWGEKRFKAFVQLADELARREIQRRLNEGEFDLAAAAPLHAWLRRLILGRSGLANVIAEPGKAWQGDIAAATSLDDFAGRAAAALLEKAP